MRFLISMLLAASAVPVSVTDERGKKPSGVVVEASEPDEDGWYRLSVTKSKGEVAMVWPFDGRAPKPDGPEPVGVTVIAKGDAKALGSPRVVAMLAVPVLLGRKILAEVAAETGLDAAAIEKAIVALGTSEEGFEKGIALLWAGKPVEAKEQTLRGLKGRERVMTPIASDIYPAAMLHGKALLGAGKFDDAAVAFGKAVKLRNSDASARRARAEALQKAGKPDAADEVLKRR